MARLLPQQATLPATPAEARYRLLLEECAKSGLKQRDFATKKGIAPATLSWWRSELARRDRSRASSGAGDPNLVPVQIVDRGHGADFLVELRSRRLVAVKRGFDAGELKRLIEVLESC